MLKEKYHKIIAEYIDEFCRKQKIEFDGWVGQEVGGVASFVDQYFFNLSDITYDIDHKCKKGLILKWQDDCVENSEMPSINYHSYHKGLRFEHIKRNPYEQMIDTVNKRLYGNESISLSVTEAKLFKELLKEKSIQEFKPIELHNLKNPTNEED